MKTEVRRTRSSAVAGDFAPPYNVEHHLHKWDDGLTHTTALYEGAMDFVTCCRKRFAGSKRVDDQAPTCFACVICRGCPSCVPGYVRESTMRLGKWETKDNRKLYVFEMDDQHLRNSIAKLTRDEGRFKPNWEDWLIVLNVDATLRGFE